ncbi:protein LYK5-like [Triticum aestivum]|nr:protein LYK5-like [Triticum aestivum]
MAIATAVHHLLLALALFPLAAAQHEYQANAQSDCYANNGSSVLGYTCSDNSSSIPACATYVAFRSDLPSYGSTVTVAYLLNASAPAIATANDVPVASPVRNNTLLLVPVPCAFTAAGLYQHDAAYVVQFADETYFSIANDTYQGLSTCQALMEQNHARDSDIYLGVALTVPLRCACPSAAQAAAGVRYLVTYVLDWDDYALTVAQRFGADYQALLHANSIDEDTTVYPFTTMLVPLKDPPTSQIAVVLPEPPAPPPASSSGLVPPVSSSESSRWWVTVGVSAGCSALALGAMLALFVLWRQCWRHGDQNTKTTPWHAPAKGALMWPTVEAVDVREAVWSLTVHDYGDLERATSGFSKEQRIGNSSVYRAVINGGAAAVKRMPSDDVGAETEVNVLGRLNHSSLVRLSGLCMHGGNTYMVFEFAEKGALSDWLHVDGGEVLGWSRRVQVALDVAGGLNYLHNYTDPPYVHRNLKSSNILLDACFRAKLSNFGHARAITVDADAEDDGLWMTGNEVGTQGYLAPEYVKHWQIGPQLDVFAFGVVLLELLSGKEAAVALDGDGGRANNGKVVLLREEAERLGRLGEGDGAKDDLLDRVTAFIDGRLDGRYLLDVALAMLTLALRCVAREPRARPSMAKVLLSLSGMYSTIGPSGHRISTYCPDREQ